MNTIINLWRKKKHAQSMSSYIIACLILECTERGVLYVQRVCALDIVPLPAHSSIHLRIYEGVEY